MINHHTTNKNRAPRISQDTTNKDSYNKINTERGDTANLCNGRIRRSRKKYVLL